MRAASGRRDRDSADGFGYWAGKGYGFSSDGRVTEINVATGSSIIFFTLQDGGAGIPWFGAGVTTAAPVR